MTVKQCTVYNAFLDRGFRRGMKLYYYADTDSLYVEL